MTVHLSEGPALHNSTSGPLNITKSAGSIPSMLKRDKTCLSHLHLLSPLLSSPPSLPFSLLPSLSFFSTNLSTAEDLIPAYSKFKGAFESLLEGQDFSKKKRELLQRMSKEQKWSLLTQYKDSTLHLLVTPPPSLFLL